MPPWTGPDDHSASARRHLCDAEHLLAADRWDGAVHLAGFAGECALKSVFIATLGASYNPKNDFRHDLDSTAGWVEWLVAASGSPLAANVHVFLKGSILGDRHPERRYWPDTWNQIEAEQAVQDARRVVEHTLFARVLDQGLALKGP